jgi:hypothetical protein
VRIAYDLTRTEREQEKQLMAKAKEPQNNCSGEFRLKIRGPSRTFDPRTRKIVKIRPEEK